MTKRKPRGFVEIYARSEAHRHGQLAKERSIVRMEFRRRKKRPLRLRAAKKRWEIVY